MVVGQLGGITQQARPHRSTEPHGQAVLLPRLPRRAHERHVPGCPPRLLLRHTFHGDVDAQAPAAGRPDGAASRRQASGAGERRGLGCRQRRRRRRCCNGGSRQDLAPHTPRVLSVAAAQRVGVGLARVRGQLYTPCCAGAGHVQGGGGGGSCRYGCVAQRQASSCPGSSRALAKKHQPPTRGHCEGTRRPVRSCNTASATAARRATYAEQGSRIATAGVMALPATAHQRQRHQRRRLRRRLAAAAVPEVVVMKAYAPSVERTTRGATRRHCRCRGRGYSHRCRVLLACRVHDTASRRPHGGVACWSHAPDHHWE